jgi:methionine-rich copper-binding protein CopC
VAGFSLIESKIQGSKVRKSNYLTLLAASFFLFTPSAAFANSLTASSPVAGSVLTVAPNAISMTTASPLLEQGNSIVVNDPNGVAVDDGSISVTGNNAIVGLKALTVAGVYTVNYSLLASNDAPVAGSYTFQFNAPPVIKTPTTPSSPALSPTTSKPSSSQSSVNTGANTFVYVLLILAFLVLVFLVIYAKQTFDGTKKRSRKQR